jgi:deazaflavin-dependent oxidoreductase (nitroreductase family)
LVAHDGAGDDDARGARQALRWCLEAWLAAHTGGGRAALRTVGTLHRLVYRWSAGGVGGRLRGGPVLLLTTTGRVTGRARTWPLSYVVAGDGLVVVASARGAQAHPAWYLNLRANDRVHVHGTLPTSRHQPGLLSLAQAGSVQCGRLAAPVQEGGGAGDPRGGLSGGAARP